VIKEYVEKVEGVYQLTGTRVSLDSVVQAFWHGQTAESIAQSFAVLTLEQVYGALTFSLANKSEVDAYLLKVYRFDEPEHYVSCIFNGLWLLKKDQGIYMEYLRVSRNSLNLQYKK
jgi:uncharacterized protein (DUF433 family)